MRHICSKQLLRCPVLMFAALWRPSRSSVHVHSACAEHMRPAASQGFGDESVKTESKASALRSAADSFQQMELRGLADGAV